MPSQFGNTVVASIVNSPFHFLLGKGFAVLTLPGHRSGKSFSTPVNLIQVNGTLTVISMRSRTWWRNLRDGRVELVAEGDSPELDAFLEAIAASELSAFVRERAVMRSPATGEWRDFHIRHDD